MVVPFRDATGDEELGKAAFFRMSPTPEGQGYGAGLLVINSRGEPLEFAHNSIDIVQRFLWRGDDLYRHALRTLAASLFEVCESVPTVIVCLAREVPRELFLEDIETTVPVCLVSADEYENRGEGTEGMQQPAGELSSGVEWLRGAPEGHAPERRLVAGLATTGMLLEPFERITVGLNELFSASRAAD